ncbi:YpiF family protein [Aquibacillus saliphilus]|uniref:YpiF family protein n=1 Tax=Aquibacillus saliphilus TaxID=1909422 RepID=UPI001CF0C506|nr:YpiF family protein [Aquibacillus saliphilus]
MKWQKEDIDQYQGAEEFVDTLLIPLMPITMNSKKDIKKLAFQGDLLNFFANEIEKQFKGRIFLIPTYSYYESNESENEVERLNNWVNQLTKNPFKHVFFLTFDHHWKKDERNLDGNLLWFPAIQTEEIDSKQTQPILKDQITQINELIRSYW